MKSLGEYLENIRKDKYRSAGVASGLIANQPITFYEPGASMWSRLKEKALEQNNEASNQVLRMMAEIEVEVVNESFKTVKLPKEPETRLYNVEGVKIK